MSLESFFVYSWHVDDSETEVTCIRAYGLNKQNKTVCVRIDDFTPYVYVQLPEIPKVVWDERAAQILGNKIDELLLDKKPIKKKLMFKKKLYYAHIVNDREEKKEEAKKKRRLFPFLFLSFSSSSDIRMLLAKVSKPLYIPLICSLPIRLKVHENNAPIFLQLACARDVPLAGWIQFLGKEVKDSEEQEEKVTTCDFEYKAKWTSLVPMKDCTAVIKPLILSYDIEVYSSNPNKMPDAKNPRDVVFQISCILGRNGDDDSMFEKYLLTLCEPNPQVVGEDVEILMYNNEMELLLGFVQFIQEKQPNIICGYNIFTFDIPYMIQKAKEHFIINDFDRQGFDKYGHAKEKTITWSSSAYKNQSFQFMDAEGRLFVDLLPIIRRDYKLSNYTLKAVTDHFLGETKDPLTPKGIFRCYDLGRKGGEKGAKAMGIVGKYCVQDSALVLKLFTKLQIWFGLSEMASICNVSVFDLFTRGQQLKVFSQVYKKCMAENVVVERDGYVPKDDEHYQGAHVFEPVPGVYDCVVPFDFASLYPSIIIAYNIDYSTLVPEDSDIPDSDCHIIEWEEHIGCEHEERKRKTKPKHILCGHRKFRFLKTHKGILPALLEDLLLARKKTRNEIKTIEAKIKSGSVSTAEKDELETYLNVLDKRQLSYKVSANSGYGAMGVSVGFLPLMPGAMCVTAKGRQSIELVARMIPEQFGGKLVYGDTDSNYVIFPHLSTPQEIWAHAEKVSEEISKNFPKPMKLEFEGVIYWRFLILTMKRYMSLKCDKEGNVSKKIEKKGVLLSRRDNSNFVRTVYSDIIMKIFDKKADDEILYDATCHIQKLCAYGFPYKDFIVTKSVGLASNGSDPKTCKIPLPIPGKKGKGMLGNYTIPLLPLNNPQEKQKKMDEKQAISDEDFYIKCLPAQVQLAEKIRRRGGRVDVGVRLEYLVLKTDNAKAKQYDKIESADYYKEHNETLEIDFLYYLKALANPLDQVLECTVGQKGKDFTYTMYKQQVIKQTVLAQLLRLFEPKLRFFDGEKEFTDNHDIGSRKKQEKKPKKVKDETKIKNEPNETTNETNEPNEKGLFLFTDGASKGNPGPAGAGAVLFDENGKEILADFKYLGIRTNNEAEVEGVVLGVEICKTLDINPSEVHLRADSKLVINHISGGFKVRNEVLRSLYEKLGKVKFKTTAHVYREKNKRADELANIAISQQHN
jgi:DNA polymerase elongation subunit (family B)/ribonuclease HI